MVPRSTDFKVTTTVSVGLRTGMQTEIQTYVCVCAIMSVSWLCSWLPVSYLFALLTCFLLCTCGFPSAMVLSSCGYLLIPHTCAPDFLTCFVSVTRCQIVCCSRRFSSPACLNLYCCWPGFVPDLWLSHHQPDVFLRTGFWDLNFGFVDWMCLPDTACEHKIG